jgi:uncharacterized cupin superfamily protein
MTIENPKFLLHAAEIDAQADSFSHPWNDNSLVTGTRMSRLAGLQRVGVSKVMVPPGKESFIYHSHHCEEEWIYILSGKGMARIDGSEHEVSAGDFMGFPTPSVAHHLANPFNEDLVYLMGGESKDVEIADFPDIGKRMLRRGADVEIFDAADAKPFGAEIDP